MPIEPVPQGYHSVQPYLTLQGAKQALAFYQQALGATVVLCMERQGRVAHAEMRIGDSVVMLSDENPTFGTHAPPHYGGSPVSLLVYLADCDGVYRQALAAGAVSVQEPADQPYGDRMAGVKDPFGYTWYLATHIIDRRGPQPGLRPGAPLRRALARGPREPRASARLAGAAPLPWSGAARPTEFRGLFAPALPAGQTARPPQKDLSPAELQALA